MRLTSECATRIADEIVVHHSEHGEQAKIIISSIRNRLKFAGKFFKPEKELP